MLLLQLLLLPLMLLGELLAWLAQMQQLLLLMEMAALLAPLGPA